jgi:uncharacterized membrane protein
MFHLPLREKRQKMLLAYRDLNDVLAERETFGQHLADRVASIGGSWGFIIGFTLFLLCWTVINTVLPGKEVFDPFPFIFLNLVLSMVAALQAPIIMMSQNRQSEKDRLAARLDYEVNLRAEQQICRLQEEITALREDLRRLSSMRRAARAEGPAADS